MTESLRVALITHYPQDPTRIVGGIQAVSFRIVEELRKISGLEIHVIHCHSDVLVSRTVAQGNVTLHFLAQTRRRLIPNMATKIGPIAALLRSLAPDVVHAHEHNLALAAIRAGYAPIWTIHGVLAAERTQYRGLFNRLNFALAQYYDRRALGQVRSVTTVSRYVVEAYRGRAAVETWRVIENPAPSACFELPRRPVAGRVLMPAAVIPLKDPLTLVAAAGQARGQIPGLEVHIAGPLADAGYVTEVRAEIGRLGLAGCVRLMGNLDVAALGREYSEAAVVALPSRQEVTPMAVVEAMAAGVPVVASAVGGVPYVVADGVTGRTVPPADPTTLAGALIELLTRPDAARRMGQAAQAVAQMRFRPEVIAEQYLALYQEQLR
ncbi:MAG: glycosyltransferase family 4 protein [Chloroflexi bacterium]|nr:glycosyltransferase family 4 protein [Chloroflexota bacterium]